MSNPTIRCALALVFTACALPALAKVTPEAAAKLGKELTPVGAVAAANADGTIPAWTGGMKDLGPAFKDYKAGSGAYYPDVFAGEKPLFKITHSNIANYADKLPLGIKRMLEIDKDKFYLNVYPTHRTPVFPDAVYEATKANALTAELVGDDGLKNSHLGFPFPIPGSGAEVIVNHRVRYRGDSVVLSGSTFVVNRTGGFQMNTFQTSVNFGYGNVSKPGSIEDNMIVQVIKKELSPPRLAGNVTLVWEHIDGKRDAWQYSPGTNRVRQAPIVAYDNPVAGSDGLQNVDQNDMFNGSQHRYSWKLLGRKEMYIGYNNYKIMRPELKYKQIIQAGHLNPELLRYELHRVWVVEATLKKGEGNVYSKRVFYIDEDSWTIAAADLFDSRGTLWRFQEGYVMPLVADKSVVCVPQVFYDLFSGRYAVNNLLNEQGFVAKFGVPFPPGYFTPQNLQKLGRS
ncbi:MAG TPA: DUF1329 domain-containing protein [Solimonas sp.]|nr:DUF1329 domain-containing protein [Solimonas sp.]